ncbi:MAG: hypothetical protein HY600_07330 [Candidatus Omnitrophica bacterium]|nr:hypothetical protein [Candidatus Omnitrophota bacterium]
MNGQPFFSASRGKNGFFCLLRLALAITLVTSTTPTVYALTEDGATDALLLRYQAEQAIAQEEQAGRRELAGAMRDTLPHLLQEYLVTRDGTIALDTVDAAFVREQFKVARAMEEPGVALAMDIYAGDATGFEHNLQTSLSRLADHQVEIAERAQEHANHGADRVSERVVDAYERQIERQLDKVEHDLEKINAASGRFEAKFEARMEAKLDAAAARLEVKAAKAELKAIREEAKAEVKAAKEEAKAEAKAEVKAAKEEAKAEAKVEKIAEKVEEKAEKIAEKVEEKAEKIAEKAAEKADDKPKKK